VSIYTGDTDIIQIHRNDVQNDTTPKVKLIIHRQFPGIKLTSSVYAGRSATCCLPPDQSVDAGSTVQVDFRIDPAQNRSIGVLMYNLKNTDQFNEDGISTEEEPICIQLFIIWKVNRFKDLLVVSDPIKVDRDPVWDRDKPIGLAKHYKLYYIRYDPTEVTYLMYNDIVLMTRMNRTHEKEMLQTRDYI
jgi:hypothetical protein